MNIKKAAVRSAVIIAIVLLSVLFGVIFQNLSVKMEKNKYPIRFNEFVERYSDEYGVPKNVIYAVIKCESSFDSSLLSDDGKIGLMQIMPQILEDYKTELHDPYDTGMLYDPETNIKYGTYRLSKLYLKLGTWKAVFAAMKSGEDTVLGWLEDERYAEIAEFAKPKLINIPYKDTEKYTETLLKTAETYKRLYFDN